LARAGVAMQAVCKSRRLSARTGEYRNSPVMRESVPEELKPCIFADGVRAPSPLPRRGRSRSRSGSTEPVASQPCRAIVRGPMPSRVWLGSRHLASPRQHAGHAFASPTTSHGLSNRSSIAHFPVQPCAAIYKVYSLPECTVFRVRCTERLWRSQARLPPSAGSSSADS